MRSAQQLKKMLPGKARSALFMVVTLQEEYQRGQAYHCSPILPCCGAPHTGTRIGAKYAVPGFHQGFYLGLLDLHKNLLLPLSCTCTCTATSPAPVKMGLS
jgi:hypothetical protein